MCLTLRDKSYEPYLESKIRWKVVERIGNALCAPYRGGYYNSKGRWNKAQSGYLRERFQCGFHVFVTRKDARKLKRLMDGGWNNHLVVKVEVDGFLASGTFKEQRSETWKSMKILR